MLSFNNIAQLELIGPHAFTACYCFPAGHWTDAVWWENISLKRRTCWSCTEHGQRKNEEREDSTMLMREWSVIDERKVKIEVTFIAHTYNVQQKFLYVLGVYNGLMHMTGSFSLCTLDNIKLCKKKSHKSFGHLYRTWQYTMPFSQNCVNPNIFGLI